MCEFFQERPDTGKHNRGVVMALGAGWCGPCKVESEHFAEILVDQYRPDDIEFLHLIMENQTDQPANDAMCADWRDNIAQGKYPIRYTDDLALKAQIIPPLWGLPVLYMLDANAHVRFTVAGTQSDDILGAEIQGMINDPYGG
jgi:hypothetical protein